MSAAPSAAVTHVVAAEKDRKVLADDARKLLFTEARTNSYYLPIDVPEEKLKELYELWKYGPTAANTTPARVLFVKSNESKSVLEPALLDSNKDKVATAPITAIIAYDEKFYEQLPRLAPPLAYYKDFLAGNAAVAKGMAEQNSALQAAYFIIAARAVGLDAGPMGGFDRATVDKLFFESSEERKTWKSQVIVNLGYSNPEKLHPRFTRLAFEEVNVVV